MGDGPVAQHKFATWISGMRKSREHACMLLRKPIMWPLLCMRACSHARGGAPGPAWAGENITACCRLRVGGHTLATRHTAHRPHRLNATEHTHTLIPTSHQAPRPADDDMQQRKQYAVVHQMKSSGPLHAFHYTVILRTSLAWGRKEALHACSAINASFMPSSCLVCERLAQRARLAHLPGSLSC